MSIFQTLLVTTSTDIKQSKFNETFRGKRPMPKQLQSYKGKQICFGQSGKEVVLTS